MTRNRRTTASVRAQAISKTAGADSMFAATSRSNDKATAYFYGNLGDSVERRYNGGGDGLLGGGHDGFQGTFGTGQSWNAQGPGNYFGTGLINGVGRMFSGAHGGMGGGGGFTYLKRFSSSAAFMHSLIAQCELAYLGYGVVRNIIDLYADFATEGISIDHPDESVRNFYRAWATKIGLKERVHSMFLNLFVSGNTFVHRRWATLEPKEKRALKRTKSSRMVGDALILERKTIDHSIEVTESDFIDWYLSKGEIHLSNDECNGKTQGKAPAPGGEEQIPENPEKRIPWGYTFLNPLQMEMRGRRIRGENHWVMAIDKQDTLEIARGLGMGARVELGSTRVNLPKEFLSRVQKYQGPGSGYHAEVKLGSEELAIIQAPGKWDWFDWAVPFVYPSLRALNFKDCLRNMEMRACQSVINSIFLFKLGNIDKGMPAEEEHFERLADMLQQPADTMNLLWNEAIEAEVLQPDIKDIFDVKKHESADKDILTALGIPEVLIGGKGGNFSNSFISVATVLEKLESYRDRVSTWLMGELKIVAEAMDFQKLPTVRFGRTSLRDEKAYQAFLTGLYDRNVISADTLVREAGTTIDIEVDKLKDESKVRKKNILEPRGPFVKEPKPPAAGAKKPGGVVPKAKPKTPNGRPTGTSTGPTGKQSNPRGPKGQNVADAWDVMEMQEVLLAEGRVMLDQIESFCGQQLLKAKAKENPSLKNLKQLRAVDRERLEQLIYNVFSHMPPPPDGDLLKDDFIVNMLRSDAADSVKADVLEIYTDKITYYSATYGKVPTKEMRRQFMVSAWTQCAIIQHVNGKPGLLGV